MGHILRLDVATPASQAIDYYFRDNNLRSFKGKARLNILFKLMEDYVRYVDPKQVPEMLRNFVSMLKVKAKDKEMWQAMVMKIETKMLQALSKA